MATGAGPPLWNVQRVSGSFPTVLYSCHARLVMERVSFRFEANIVSTVGSGTCDGKKVEGEICWPKMDENGQPVGDNRLILH